MAAKPKPSREPNRLKARTSLTLDPATVARLERIRDRTAGIESLSAAVRYAAQFCDDRTAKPKS